MGSTLSSKTRNSCTCMAELSMTLFGGMEEYDFVSSPKQALGCQQLLRLRVPGGSPLSRNLWPLALGVGACSSSQFY